MKGHRPNHHKDQRKRTTEYGVCSIAGCFRPSGISYYGFCLCNTCYDYYSSDNIPEDALKRVLRIKETAKKTKRTAEPAEDEFDIKDLFPDG